jgi:ubiquinone/menaquinone biosynthesis C-methylase UbiE
MDADTYEKFYGNRKYYGDVAASRRYVDSWISENYRDKIFLDYACGDGANAIKAAKAGAKLSIGLDISRVSIKNAKKDALLQGVEENTFFVQADAENTLLPDNSVEVIVCSGMLQHLNLSYAFLELRKILQVGGKILAVEALIDCNDYDKQKDINKKSDTNLMNFKFKCVLQHLFSSLPYGERLNYFFQRNITKSLLVTNEGFIKKVKGSYEHFQKYNKLANFTKNHYEFGAGWDLINPISLSLLGLSESICIDIRKLVFP